uniref:PfkB domain-containing protein n=1 Tax=Angiostrongylus cantonensis TaxID=6313 RepID=A0A0K0D5Z6_ANGCA
MKEGTLIKGIQSKEVTPFLLSRVNELTCGASMKLNIDLLENNARIAGQLASLLSKSKLGQNFRVVVVGATIIDFESITNEDVKNDGGTYAGWVAQRCGGVGRNHADALTRYFICTAITKIPGKLVVFIFNFLFYLSACLHVYRGILALLTFDSFPRIHCPRRSSNFCVLLWVLLEDFFISFTIPGGVVPNFN